MRSRHRQRVLFREWAPTYEASLAEAAGFPLGGHGQVLGRLLEVAAPAPGMRVLDLGTGTGRLAALFAAAGCRVYATDLSRAMVRQARRACPGVRAAVGELGRPLPPSFPATYHSIVSAYAFHHLGLRDKVRAVEELARRHLCQSGRLLVADISFPDAAARRRARRRWRELWDEEESYWAARETAAALASRGLAPGYEQVNAWTGLYVITAASGP